MSYKVVEARLKKWPPNREGFSYFRILCGKQVPSGQYCPAELGHVTLITRKKGSDPRDPKSYSTPRVVPRLPGGGDISDRAIGEFAPELALVIPEEPHHHDMEGGDEGVWIVTDERGYRFDKSAKYFVILRRHKYALTGAHAARRPMTAEMAVALEERIDPYGHYGFTADRALLGNVPVLEATILCPRCPTLNHVRRPTNDDLGPPPKT